MTIKPIILTVLLPFSFGLGSGGYGSSKSNSEQGLTQSDIVQLKALYGDGIRAIGSRYKQKSGEWVAEAWIYGPPEISPKGNCFRTLTTTGAKKGKNGETKWLKYFAEPRRQIQHVIWIKPAGNEKDCQQLNLRTATSLNTAIEEATLIRMSEALPEILKILQKENRILGQNSRLRVPENTKNYSIFSIDLGLSFTEDAGTYSVNVGDLKNRKNPHYSMIIETRKDGGFIVTGIGEVHY